MIGMTQEQSPVYRHILSTYRRAHPNTTLGGPPTEGGFPGYNSGVMLVDINKLRQSKIISECLGAGGCVSVLVCNNEYNNFSCPCQLPLLHSFICPVSYFHPLLLSHSLMSFFFLSFILRQALHSVSHSSHPSLLDFLCLFSGYSLNSTVVTDR